MRTLVIAEDHACMRLFVVKRLRLLTRPRRVPARALEEQR